MAGADFDLGRARRLDVLIGSPAGLSSGTDLPVSGLGPGPLFGRPLAPLLASAPAWAKLKSATTGPEGGALFVVPASEPDRFLIH